MTAAPCLKSCPADAVTRSGGVGGVAWACTAQHDSRPLYRPVQTSRSSGPNPGFTGPLARRVDGDLTLRRPSDHHATYCTPSREIRDRRRHDAGAASNAKRLPVRGAIRGPHDSRARCVPCITSVAGCRRRAPPPLLQNGQVHRPRGAGLPTGFQATSRPCAGGAVRNCLEAAAPS
jgi:hypothetical protein